MTEIPALRRGLAVLRLLAERAGPVSAATITRELALPRSTTYHLLTELSAAGFVTYLPAERRYALGIAAIELGSAYWRREPLERLAGPILRQLADDQQHTAHLGVLHGNELLYLIKERPRRPETVVTEAGVRLPAHLTASGRAMLARLPKAQVRVLFPGREDFVRRTGRGPRYLTELRQVLSAETRTGWAVEDGFITRDFASVAYPVVDHSGHPIAAVSMTFRHECPGERPCGETWPRRAAAVRDVARELTQRLRGRDG
jgi:DNA-binding IclR family transcriptional regulator